MRGHSSIIFMLFFRGRKLDLIVRVGAPAAFFLQRHRQTIFPTTPMLDRLGRRGRISRHHTFGQRGQEFVCRTWTCPPIKNIVQLLPATKI